MTNEYRALIVNADDFGIDKHNVDIIMDCYAKGSVSSISMFAAMPGSQYGFSQLDKCAVKGVGAHLSFTCGKPFLSKNEIPSLVGEKGDFYSPQELMKHLEKVDPSELKREFDSQIHEIKNHTTLTHLDNHRPEIYFRPSLFEVVLELATEHNVPLRLPFDDKFDKIAAAQLAKIFGVDAEAGYELGASYRKKCSDLNLSHSNFYFQPQFEQMGFAKTKELIAGLPFGVTEICTHPGEQNFEASLWKDRTLKDFIESQNICLISYADIRKFL